MSTHSLVDKRVCKVGSSDTAQLLARDNVDLNQLEVFVREVATYIKLPEACKYAQNHWGKDDVAIFDFSRKQQAVKNYRLVGEQEGNKGLVALVGDALIEPFWPLGTGANRAVLAALDTAWMVKGRNTFTAFFHSNENLNVRILISQCICVPSDTPELFSNGGNKQVTGTTLTNIQAGWSATYRVLMTSSPEDLVGNFGLHTIDPKTRYKKTIVGHFH